MNGRWWHWGRHMEGHSLLTHEIHENWFSTNKTFFTVLYITKYYISHSVIYHTVLYIPQCFNIGPILVSDALLYYYTSIYQFTSDSAEFTQR